MKIERGDGWTLVLGDWRDVELPMCDAVIEDPPYGRRTHEGQRAERATSCRNDRYLTSTGDLGYDHWEPADVEEACGAAHALCGGWIVGMTSHDLLPHWESVLVACGRYVFAPVPIVIRGMNVRIAGDGPSNWTIHTIVSRLRTGKKCWGTKPGAYVEIPEDPRVARGVKGAKPLPIMLAVVRDYSERGDLVVDRFAGSGTTGIAAVTLGRRFFGCERDPEHFEIAVSRLRNGCARPDRGLGPLFDFESATGGSDREDGDESGPPPEHGDAVEAGSPAVASRPQRAAHDACAEVGNDDTAHPEASETSPDSLPSAAVHGPANPWTGTDGVHEPCDDYTIPGDAIDDRGDPFDVEPTPGAEDFDRDDWPGPDDKIGTECFGGSDFPDDEQDAF